MQIVLFGKDHLEISPALDHYVHDKLSRLSRHYEQHCEVRVQLGRQKTDFCADASLHVPGQLLHADASASTMYAAIDLLADKLDRIVLKHKQKRLLHAPPVPGASA